MSNSSTMVYDDPLSEKDYVHFTPNGEVLRYLEEARRSLGLEKHQMKVLDWGSGRGEYVVHLRDAGYDAYGAEIRKEAAERGRAFMQGKGYDFDRIIRPIGPQCLTDFAPASFHFVFSHYVFEHVENLDQVVREIARVTAPGGFGFHVYPGKFRPIEPHLFMPCVHWLPKNRSRWWAIRTCLAVGNEPRWSRLDGATPAAKADAYSDYCNEETFYRPYSEVVRQFERDGIVVKPVVLQHPAVARMKALQGPATKKLLEKAVLTFQTVEIMTQKTARG